MCAAIKLDDTIYRGRYHGECLAAMKLGSTQGFIADSYSGTRFVGRKEALEIAKKAGQKITKHHPVDVLLSEDLKEDNLFNHRGG